MADFNPERIKKLIACLRGGCPSDMSAFTISMLMQDKDKEIEEKLENLLPDLLASDDYLDVCLCLLLIALYCEDDGAWLQIFDADKLFHAGYQEMSQYAIMGIILGLVSTWDVLEWKDTEESRKLTTELLPQVLVRFVDRAENVYGEVIRKNMRDFPHELGRRIKSIFCPPEEKRIPAENLALVKIFSLLDGLALLPELTPLQSECIDQFTCKLFCNSSQLIRISILKTFYTHRDTSRKYYSHHPDI